MTFKLELSDNAIFKTVFDSIASIIDEVTIVFDSEGMRLNALDRSHITFITLELAPEVFDSYICDTPEKVTVDCDRFNKILKNAKPMILYNLPWMKVTLLLFLRMMLQGDLKFV